MRIPTVTMPGKKGDVLASMAVARQLAGAGKVNVITSAYCAPLVEYLARCLPFVRGVFAISEAEYKIEHTHFGAQPWEMPVNAVSVDDLGEVFHLGFRHFPRPTQTIFELAGEPYQVRPEGGPWLRPIDRREQGPIAMHLAADTHWMLQLAMFKPVPVRLFGTAQEIARYQQADIPRAWRDVVQTNDYLDIFNALHGCSAFVGSNSGPSILAMGGGLPVMWPHRPDIEQERWANYGCDVTTIDMAGVVRRLRNRDEVLANGAGAGEPMC